MECDIIKIPLRGRFAGQFAIVDRTEAVASRRAAGITYYGYNLNIGVDCGE